MESRRIEKFRRNLITMIPRFPNDKSSKASIEALHLVKLLIVYISWRMRLVVPRKRIVVIRSDATEHLEWSRLKSDIDILLDKVRHGDNLSPHLSLRALKKGYSPNAHAKNAPPADRWEEKDFVLNTNGFHHFHLGTVMEREGYLRRSKYVLFANVTPSEFQVIGLFDHEVFDSPTPTGDINAERLRLLQIHESMVFEGLPPGTVVISNPIMLSGHTLQAVTVAQRCARVIQDIDPKLDDFEYVKGFYTDTCAEQPKNVKLRWMMNDVALGLFDGKTFFVLIPGRG